MSKLHKFLVLFILALGLFFRLYHIEFGLPHSFYADEPEIAELAIRYTYEIRNIIKNNDYYQLIPISFVYGTFPAYLFTLATMTFSKLSNLLSLPFDKTSLYVFMRSFNALLSIFIVLSTAVLSYKLRKKWLVFFVTLLLVALNWKLIVHAHYINADLIQTIVLSLSYLTLFYYFRRKEEDTKFTLLTGALLGLAIGTKITTLITLPLFYYPYIRKKDYRGLAALNLVALGVFMMTNPFSFILSERFTFRILSMFTKEGGLVFDSVDLSVYKYIFGLGFITTPLVLLSSLYGKYKSFKERVDLDFHIFLVGSVIIYLVFFTLQSRRVDRWLLPILPIVLMYASFGLDYLLERLKSRLVLLFVAILLLASYLYFPTLLLHQFQRYTPKSAAYLWMRDNLDPIKSVLVYSEEGLDPMNKLVTSKVVTLPVYSSEGAQFQTPENLEHYSYVVISSRPLSNYKREVVRETYPFYYQTWKEFEETILDPRQFMLINQFVLPKPNLIPLSDVFIYENLAEVKPQPKTLYYK